MKEKHLLILTDREKRWQYRHELVTKYSCPVISVTMNIPGPNKTKESYLKATEIFFREIVCYFENLLVFQERRVGYDGPEIFLVVRDDARAIKKQCINIEENHPIGRLLDIDVMDENKKILSRRELNYDERKCLICNNLARECIILRKHSTDELLQKIDIIIENYIKDSLRRG